MPLPGFEPTTSTGKRQQTYALERAAAGIGLKFINVYLDIWLQGEG
jgi:hypothetical protein